jgi:hypothetical protein
MRREKHRKCRYPTDPSLAGDGNLWVQCFLKRLRNTKALSINVYEMIRSYGQAPRYRAYYWASRERGNTVIISLKAYIHKFCTRIYRVIKVLFIHQLMHKWIVLKTILKFTLKFTLKQLPHVSVQSPSSGSALFELAKITFVKIIN